MKIHLTVGEEYCASWGLFESVREFMQNGRDATRMGCTFDATYMESAGTIRIRTVGAVLSHRSLLIGESSKRGRRDMLGEQGEGYKIGSLVLARLGKGVKIRTGEELWVPMLEYSKKFGAKVLTFDISANRKHINEIQVDITGISADEWAGMKDKFLFVDDGGQVMVESSAGTIIQDGVGNIYVDGIWVCRESKLRHGYDFRPADVSMDRDRRLISSFDVQKLSSRAWESLYLRESGEHCAIVDRMLADNAPDVEHFQYAWCVGQVTRQKVAERFKEKFGQTSLAVRTESEARELEFHGRKAQVVDAEPLRNILESSLGTVESVRRSLAEEIKSEQSTIDLTPHESKNLLMAIEFVSKAVELCGSQITKDIKVVEFNSPSVMGMRKGENIYLSRTTLASFQEALKTLVEEVAHEFGADGTHSHVERMHEIYAQGVAMLLEASTRSHK